MPARSVLLTCSVIFAVLALLFWRSFTQAQITNPQPAAPAGQLQAGELQSVTLVFGTLDSQPAKWDGAASLSTGEIVKIEGYHFSEADNVSGNSWQCSTRPWPGFPGGLLPTLPQPYPTQVEPVGVTIHLRAAHEAEMRVRIQQGEFAFRPTDIPENRAIYPLRSTVQVYRTPIVEQLTDGEYEDDYPAIAADGDRVWVAWQGYQNESDQIFLRSRSGGRWSDRLTVTEKPGDLFKPAIHAAGGKVTIVWSERDGENWNLRSRAYDDTGLGRVETLGTGLFHRLAGDATGNLHLAYQSWRKGRSDIYYRARLNGAWSEEIVLSDSRRDARANDWSPDVVVDRDGTAWIAWDSYASGSYNIILRSVRNGKPGDVMRVTDSGRFHAHPSLAVDSQNRLWIAWDQAPENWGKDVGFLLSGGTSIYESRSIQLAVLEKGRWRAPLQQPADIVPQAFRRYFQTPRLAADFGGRIWLFARPRTSAQRPFIRFAAGGRWEVMATHYSADRWSELILIPGSVGRNEGEMEVAADASGNVHVALAGDHRLWGGGRSGRPPGNHDILFATLRAGSPVSLKTGARPPEPPVTLPTEPREREQVAALRRQTITVDGKTYKVFRGDLHRHTDISSDGAGDGSLFDSYRYALDAAGLDYYMVTDHQSGGQEYSWWRIEKSSDMFHVPGFFTTLYGTERSMGYPNGHRNLIFTKRGVRILPITPEERKTSTGPILYPYLRKNDGLATSHTSNTDQGTDWRDNDPALEPIVEIFQGARASAEHEGAPLSPTSKRTDLWPSGYQPLGYVWNAWAKGYKLGVQASSDHISTHLSYACVIAENSSREALVDAMRKRHTYAATANILLDYRMTAAGRTWLQGDILESATLPEINARIIGTAPLKKVVVVRDNQYIYSQEPNGETYELRYREASLSPGEHYYYVRVEQKDGNVAWASPIWVTYQPK